MPSLEVERPKLLPLRHDDERVRPFARSIRVLAEGDLLENLHCLRHADRIENAHLRTHILQRSDQRN